MFSASTKTNIRLLLLDDSLANRLTCKQALSQRQDCAFVIFERESSHSGLKLAPTHQPDCMLLDNRLPDMQDVEAVSALEEHCDYQTLPVFVLPIADTAGSGTPTDKFNLFDNAILNELPMELFRATREQQTINERSRTLDQLRESEAKYRTLVHQLPVITYIASLETPGKLLYVSPQISQLGYAADDWLNDTNGLIKHVHKDDLSITIEAYSHTHEHHAPLRCEYRLVGSDGNSRWFLDEANVVRDDSGESLFLQGVLVDITKDKATEQELFYYRQRLEELVLRRTEQLEKQCAILKNANVNLDNTLLELKKTNSELRGSEMRFRLLLESVGEGIIGLNAEGNCTFVNHSALTMLGYSQAELLGQDIQSMLGRAGSIDQVQKKQESWLQNILCESTNPSNLKTFIRKDGSHFLAECSPYPVELDELVDSLVLVFRDVTASQAQIQNLAYRASHDPLTGLVNRDEFEQRLIRVLAGIDTGKHEHVLCFLDLDHFKHINDSYGHAAGDHVLKSISALLTSKLRQRDTLARLGGDEFALLLEHTTFDQANGIADELCKCLHNMRFTWANREFSVSASIGITALLNADGDFTNVLRDADCACYEAKKKGRNQIHAFTYRSLSCLELPALNS